MAVSFHGTHTGYARGTCGCPLTHVLSARASKGRCSVPVGSRRAAGATHARGAQRHAVTGDEPSTVPETVRQEAPHADLEAAWALLREFTLKEFRGLAQSFTATRDKRQQLRDALQRAYGAPFPPFGWTASPDAEVLLGVVASDINFAARGYRDWCEALGLPLVVPTSRVDGVSNVSQISGGVYLKYNSKTQLCYVSQYTGKDRGVLLQLGQAQFGHFPLGFFDEEMAKPVPTFL